MSFFKLRHGLGAVMAIGLAALAAAVRPAAGGGHRARTPGAVFPAAWLVLVGMAAESRGRRRRKDVGAILRAARFPALFDNTPVQILEEDFSAVEAACARLRAGGVTNLVAHLIAHTALARELRALVRLRDANRPAIAAAGFAGKAEMIAQFPRLMAAPYPEVFDNQLEALWTRRRVEEEEFRYLDAEGRERACLMLQRISERNGQPDPSRVVLVLLDLTTARRTVESQMENQEVLRQALARANILLWWARVHREGGQLRWKINVPSQSYDSPLFQLATARELGGLWDIEHAPDLPEMSRRAETALLAGSPGYQQEFRVLGPDGTHWVSEDVTIQRLGKDEWSLVSVSVDNTARRQAELARMATEAQLHQILTQADCLLWRASVVRDRDQLEWGDFEVPPSGLYARLFGDAVPPANVLLWTPDIAPEWAPMVERSRRAILSGAPSYEQEFPVSLSGRNFWLHERVMIESSAPGRWRLSGVIVDATARHEAEEARKASETQLTQILTRADCLLWHATAVRDGDGVRWRNFTMPASVLCERLFGATPPATGSGLWYEADTPDLPAMTRRSTTALLSGAHGYDQEFAVKRPGGKLWLYEQVSITPAGPGQWNLVGVLVDVTARHEAEEARKASEAQLQEILQRADCLLWRARIRREGDGLRWLDFDMPPSGLYFRLFGAQKVAPEGKLRLWSLLEVPELAEMNERNRQAVLSGASDYEQDFRVIKPDGPVWLHEHVAITATGPEEWRLVGVLMDVTGRREAEQARRKAEAQLTQILTQANCLLWQAKVIENAAGILDWILYIPQSSLYRELFGADPSEHPRLMWSELNVPELPDMSQRCDQAIRGGAPGYEQEFRAQYEDQWHWLHEQVSITRVAPGEWSLVGVITDVSARRAAELALAAEKERLAVTLRAMNEGVITTDTQGVIQYANRAATELIGWDEAAMVGRPVTEVCVLHAGRMSETTTVPFERVAQENSLVELPVRTSLTSRDGTVRQVEGCCIPVHAADSELIGTVLVIRDVTEREHLEQEMVRASKLESIGILAGGIAHDFNNILTVIMGNLTLAMLDAAEHAKVEYYLRETERAALRARDLTQQLLTFAKGGDPIRSAVRLPEIVREVAEFALHGSRVKCEFDFPAELWPADADKGQLGQVVQNLVINSMQAMPEGGVIRISARNEAVNKMSQAPFVPGDFVHIAVADTGTGIKAEHLEKIFDPYFTTKQQGSGLGLATVYSIVKKHRGDIEVESELGRGTTFHIWLPARRELQLDFPASPPEAAAPLKGRVLLMDDEPTIRDTAGILLKRLGFEVELAADGSEAVQKYQAAHGAGRPYDLVVMDLTVPGGMGGQEAVERLRLIDPQVRAIVSSGYSSDPVLANYRHYGFRGMVAKPYQLDDLVRVLREVLGPRPPPG